MASGEGAAGTRRGWLCVDALLLRCSRRFALPDMPVRHPRSEPSRPIRLRTNGHRHGNPPGTTSPPNPRRKPGCRSRMPRPSSARRTVAAWFPPLRQGLGWNGHDQSPQPGSARGLPLARKSPQPGSARGLPLARKSPQPGSARGVPLASKNRATGCAWMSTGGSRPCSSIRAAEFTRTPSTETARREVRSCDS